MHLLTLGEAWINNFDPFAIQFTETFGIRWYGLSYACGFIIAFVLARLLAKRNLIALTPDQVGDFIIAAVFGVLLGGRLGWVVFYNPSAIWTFTSSLPYWEVLALGRGGMSSHGGMIGVILAMLWFAHRRKISPWAIFDVSALLVPFGLGFGRMANFINGELRGEPCSPDYPLAVKFPQEIAQDWSPAQVAEAVNVAGELGYSRGQWLNIVSRAQVGDIHAQNEFLDIRTRIAQLVTDGNEAVIDVVGPLMIPRYPSQLFQAAAEGLVLGLCLWALWWVVFRRGRLLNRPGLVSVAFMIIYGALRILTELWRLPDDGIERVMGLSRGQWLSMGMIAIGVGGLMFILLKIKDCSIDVEESAVDDCRGSQAESDSGNIQA